MRAAALAAIGVFAGSCPGGCAVPPPSRNIAEPVGIAGAPAEDGASSVLAAWRDDIGGGIRLVDGTLSRSMCGSGELACDQCGAIAGFTPVAIGLGAVVGTLGGALVAAPVNSTSLGEPFVLDDMPGALPTAAVTSSEIYFQRADGSVIHRSSDGTSRRVTANQPEAITSFTATPGLFVFATEDGGLHATLDDTTVTWSAPADQTACSLPPAATVGDTPVVFTCERDSGAVHRVELTAEPTDVALPVSGVFSAASRGSETAVITAAGLEQLDPPGPLGAPNIELVLPTQRPAVVIGIGHGWEVLDRSVRGVRAREVGIHSGTVDASADVRLDDVRCQQN